MEVKKEVIGEFALSDCDDKHLRNSQEYWDWRVKEYGTKGAIFLSTPEEHINWFTERHANLISAFSADKNVLEFGCGYGRLMKYYAKYANTYIGIDFCAELLKEAEEEAKKYSNCSVMQMDLRNLEFPEDHFDVAVAVTTITSVEGWFLDALANLKRVVKPGGLVVWLEETWTRIDYVQ